MGKQNLEEKKMYLRELSGMDLNFTLLLALMSFCTMMLKTQFSPMKWIYQVLEINSSNIAVYNYNTPLIWQEEARNKNIRIWDIDVFRLD